MLNAQRNQTHPVTTIPDYEEGTAKTQGGKAGISMVWTLECRRLLVGTQLFLVLLLYFTMFENVFL